jgi:hypothetical protein
MKKIIASLLSIAFICTSCNRDETPETPQQQEPFADFNSEICDRATGIPALYWDYSNARPVPLTEIPTIANPGELFIHSAYPQLGFTLPAGYSATEISSANPPAVGVNVIRDDNQVLWQYAPLISLQGQIPINDIVGSQVNAMFSFHNFNGNFDVICTATRTMEQSGLQFTFGARLIEFGNFTGLVWVNTVYVASINSMQVSVSISSAPTAEFSDEVFRTFLPISFQLLVIDDGVRDSDLDGTPDNQDNFPFDPDRQ